MSEVIYGRYEARKWTVREVDFTHKNRPIWITKTLQFQRLKAHKYKAIVSSR